METKRYEIVSIMDLNNNAKTDESAQKRLNKIVIPINLTIGYNGLLQYVDSSIAIKTTKITEIHGNESFISFTTLNTKYVLQKEN